MTINNNYYPDAKKYEKQFISSLDSEKACEYYQRTSKEDRGSQYRALYDYCKWLEKK